MACITNSGSFSFPILPGLKDSRLGILSILRLMETYINDPFQDRKIGEIKYGSR